MGITSLNPRGIVSQAIQDIQKESHSSQANPAAESYKATEKAAESYKATEKAAESYKATEDAAKSAAAYDYNGKGAFNSGPTNVSQEASIAINIDKFNCVANNPEELAEKASGYTADRISQNLAVCAVFDSMGRA